MLSAIKHYTCSCLLIESRVSLFKPRLPKQLIKVIDVICHVAQFKKDTIHNRPLIQYKHKHSKANKKGNLNFNFTSENI